MTIDEMAVQILEHYLNTAYGAGEYEGPYDADSQAVDIWRQLKALQEPNSGGDDESIVKRIDKRLHDGWCAELANSLDGLDLPTPPKGD